MKVNNSIDLAKKARILSLEMVTRAKSSHIGSAFSMTDIISVLYQDVLNVSPIDSDNKNRDIFILSKGHACVSLYAVLSLKGFYGRNELDSYGEDDSIFMTHISHKVNGVEFSTGSLGHGLPFAAGKALASKINKSENKVYVIVGDGELDEGSNWEALLFSSHHKLDNLVIIVDFNNLQSLTSVSNTIGLEPLREKFEAFGCNVYEVDGHDHSTLKSVFSGLSGEKLEKPNVIIAKTTKGKGVSFMENSVKWHYSSPNVEEFELAFKEINNA
jgi:transketolase